MVPGVRKRDMIKLEGELDALVVEVIKGVLELGVDLLEVEFLRADGLKVDTQKAAIATDLLFFLELSVGLEDVLVILVSLEGLEVIVFLELVLVL